MQPNVTPTSSPRRVGMIMGVTPQSPSPSDAKGINGHPTHYFHDPLLQFTPPPGDEISFAATDVSYGSPAAAAGGGSAGGGEHSPAMSATPARPIYFHDGQNTSIYSQPQSSPTGAALQYLHSPPPQPSPLARRGSSSSTGGGGNHLARQGNPLTSSFGGVGSGGTVAGGVGGSSRRGSAVTFVVPPPAEGPSMVAPPPFSTTRRLSLLEDDLAAMERLSSIVDDSLHSPLALEVPSHHNGGPRVVAKAKEKARREGRSRSGGGGGSSASARSSSSFATSSAASASAPQSVAPSANASFSAAVGGAAMPPRRNSASSSYQQQHPDHCGGFVFGAANPASTSVLGVLHRGGGAGASTNATSLLGLDRSIGQYVHDSATCTVGGGDEYTADSAIVVKDSATGITLGAVIDGVFVPSTQVGGVLEMGARGAGGGGSEVSTFNTNGDDACDDAYDCAPRQGASDHRHSHGDDGAAQHHGGYERPFFHMSADTAEAHHDGGHRAVDVDTDAGVDDGRRRTSATVAAHLNVNNTINDKKATEGSGLREDCDSPPPSSSSRRGGAEDGQQQQASSAFNSPAPSREREKAIGSGDREVDREERRRIMDLLLNGMQRGGEGGEGGGGGGATAVDPPATPHPHGDDCGGAYAAAHSDGTPDGQGAHEEGDEGEEGPFEQHSPLQRIQFDDDDDGDVADNGDDVERARIIAALTKGKGGGGGHDLAGAAAGGHAELPMTDYHNMHYPEGADTSAASSTRTATATHDASSSRGYLLASDLDDAFAAHVAAANRHIGRRRPDVEPHDPNKLMGVIGAGGRRGSGGDHHDGDLNVSHVSAASSSTAASVATTVGSTTRGDINALQYTATRDHRRRYVDGPEGPVLLMGRRGSITLVPSGDTAPVDGLRAVAAAPTVVVAGAREGDGSDDPIAVALRKIANTNVSIPPQQTASPSSSCASPSTPAAALYVTAPSTFPLRKLAADTKTNDDYSCDADDGDYDYDQQTSLPRSANSRRGHLPSSSSSSSPLMTLQYGPPKVSATTRAMYEALLGPQALAEYPPDLMLWRMQSAKAGYDPYSCPQQSVARAASRREEEAAAADGGAQRMAHSSAGPASPLRRQLAESLAAVNKIVVGSRRGSLTGDRPSSLSLRGQQQLAADGSALMDLVEVSAVTDPHNNTFMNGSAAAHHDDDDDADDANGLGAMRRNGAAGADKDTASREDRAAAITSSIAAKMALMRAQLVGGTDDDSFIQMKRRSQQQHDEAAADGAQLRHPSASSSPQTPAGGEGAFASVIANTVVVAGPPPSPPHRIASEVFMRDRPPTLLGVAAHQEAPPEEPRLSAHVAPTTQHVSRNEREGIWANPRRRGGVTTTTTPTAPSNSRDADDGGARTSPSLPVGPSTTTSPLLLQRNDGANGAATSSLPSTTPFEPQSPTRQRAASLVVGHQISSSGMTTISTTTDKKSTSNSSPSPIRRAEEEVPRRSSPAALPVTMGSTFVSAPPPSTTIWELDQTATFTQPSSGHHYSPSPPQLPSAAQQQQQQRSSGGTDNRPPMSDLSPLPHGDGYYSTFITNNDRTMSPPPPPAARRTTYSEEVMAVGSGSGGGGMLSRALDYYKSPMGARANAAAAMPMGEEEGARVGIYHHHHSGIAFGFGAAPTPLFSQSQSQQQQQIVPPSSSSCSPLHASPHSASSGGSPLRSHRMTSYDEAVEAEARRRRRAEEEAQSKEEGQHRSSGGSPPIREEVAPLTQYPPLLTPSVSPRSRAQPLGGCPPVGTASSSLSPSTTTSPANAAAATAIAAVGGWGTGDGVRYATGRAPSADATAGHRTTTTTTATAARASQTPSPALPPLSPSRARVGVSVGAQPSVLSPTNNTSTSNSARVRPAIFDSANKLPLSGGNNSNPFTAFGSSTTSSAGVDGGSDHPQHYFHPRGTARGGDTDGVVHPPSVTATITGSELRSPVAHSAASAGRRFSSTQNFNDGDANTLPPTVTSADDEAVLENSRSSPVNVPRRLEVDSLSPLRRSHGGEDDTGSDGAAAVQYLHRHAIEGQDSPEFFVPSFAGSSSGGGGNEGGRAGEGSIIASASPIGASSANNSFGGGTLRSAMMGGETSSSGFAAGAGASVGAPAASVRAGSGAGNGAPLILSASGMPSATAMVVGGGATPRASSLGGVASLSIGHNPHSNHNHSINDLSIASNASSHNLLSMMMGSQQQQRSSASLMRPSSGGAGNGGPLRAGSVGGASISSAMTTPIMATPTASLTAEEAAAVYEAYRVPSAFIMRHPPSPSLREDVLQMDTLFGQTRSARGAARGESAAQAAKEAAMRAAALGKLFDDLEYLEKRERAEMGRQEEGLRAAMRVGFKEATHARLVEALTLEDGAFRRRIYAEEEEARGALQMTFDLQCSVLRQREALLRSMHVVCLDETDARSAIMAAQHAARVGLLRDFYACALDDLQYQESRARAAITRGNVEAMQLLAEEAEELLSAIQRKEWALRQKRLLASKTSDLEGEESGQRQRMVSEQHAARVGLLRDFYAYALDDLQYQESRARAAITRGNVEAMSTFSEEAELLLNSIKRKEWAMRQQRLLLSKFNTLEDEEQREREESIAHAEHTARVALLRDFYTYALDDVTAQESRARAAIARSSTDAMQVFTEEAEALLNSIKRKEWAVRQQRLLEGKGRDLEEEESYQRQRIADSSAFGFNQLLNTFAEEAFAARRRAEERERAAFKQREERDDMGYEEGSGRGSIVSAEALARAALSRLYTLSFDLRRIEEEEVSVRRQLVADQLALRSDISTAAARSRNVALEMQQRREAADAVLKQQREKRARARKARPFIGMTLAERMVDGRLSPSKGGVSPLVIDALTIGGPAYRKGLALNDVVISVAGEPANSLLQVRQIIAKRAVVGETVEIVVRKARDVKRSDKEKERDNHRSSTALSVGGGGGDGMGTGATNSAVQSLNTSMASLPGGSEQYAPSVSANASFSTFNHPAGGGGSFSYMAPPTFTPNGTSTNAGGGGDCVATPTSQYGGASASAAATAVTYIVDVMTADEQFSDLADIYFDIGKHRQVTRATDPSIVLRSVCSFKAKQAAASNAVLVAQTVADITGLHHPNPQHSTNTITLRGGNGAVGSARGSRAPSPSTTAQTSCATTPRQGNIAVATASTAAANRLRSGSTVSVGAVFDAPPEFGAFVREDSGQSQSYLLDSDVGGGGGGSAANTPFAQFTASLNNYNANQNFSSSDGAGQNQREDSVDMPRVFIPIRTQLSSGYSQPAAAPPMASLGVDFASPPSVAPTPIAAAGASSASRGGAQVVRTNSTAGGDNASTSSRALGARRSSVTFIDRKEGDAGSNVLSPHTPMSRKGSSSIMKPQPKRQSSAVGSGAATPTGRKTPTGKK